MKGRKLPKVITEEELTKVLNITKKPQFKFAYALGFYCCLRVSEVIKLNKQDINKNLKLLHIRQAKGNKDRNIPIPPEVMKGLKKYLPINCSIRTLQRNFKNDCKKAINKDLHFHTLRHSGVTHYLVKKKWSSLQVQRLAGHSKITTTELYAHINPQDLVNQMWEE
jgi:integrase/recombinase XerD